MRSYSISRSTGPREYYFGRSQTTGIEYETNDVDLLSLWGAADTEQPVDDGRRLIDAIGAAVVALEDAGHRVIEDRLGVYRDPLDAFLTGRGAHTPAVLFYAVTR